jgi:hypothetical protein
MKRLILACLVIVLIALGFPAKTHAAVFGCPDTWSLKFEANQDWLNKRGAMGISDFPDFFKETTGKLESYSKELGVNIAVGYKSEFSENLTNWIPLKWPMKLPNDASSYYGRAFFFLHPGYTRGVYTIEIKDCKNPGVFYTDLLKTYEIKVNKDNYKIEDAVPIGLNFKDADQLAQKVKDELKLEISNYQKTKVIAENYPNDDSVVFIVPKTIGCLDFINWKWRSKGKSCDIYVYFQTPIFSSIAGNSKFLTGFNYNVIEEITLPSVQVKPMITCLKGKTTKKFSGANPICPKGFKKA